MLCIVQGMKEMSPGLESLKSDECFLYGDSYRLICALITAQSYGSRGELSDSAQVDV